MESVTPIFSFEFGSFSLIIGKEIIVQWIVMLFLGIGAFFLTRNLKRVPSKKQVVLETIYTTIENLVKGNMGESYVSYIPYIGSLMVYLLVMNLLGLIGIAPPTESLSVTAGLAISSFLVVNGTALKRNGCLHYLKAFAHPYGFMLPINIMERLILPLSLALRLFGNMMAAALLVEMVYHFLGSITWAAAIGLPVIVHSYFDLFDGTIQMLVFSMLTMINIKETTEH